MVVVVVVVAGDVDSRLSVFSLKPSLRASSWLFVADDPGSSCMTLTDKWWKKNKSSWRTCIRAGMMQQLWPAGTSV